MMATNTRYNADHPACSQGDSAWGAVVEVVIATTT